MMAWRLALVKQVVWFLEGATQSFSNEVLMGQTLGQIASWGMKWGSQDVAYWCLL